MNTFFSRNRLFLVLSIIFLLLAGTILVLIDKGDAIFFFSNYRSQVGDFFFKYGTKLGEEPAYLAAAILLIFVKIRYAFFVPLLGIGVTFLSYSLKSFFATLRPAAYFKQTGELINLNLIEGVDLYTGANSFPSGHTMSAFALYGFLAFLLPQKKGLVLFFFLLALTVAISRVYLVQHFWQDIFAGSILGVLLAILFWFVQNNWDSNTNKWWNQSILQKPSAPQV